MSASLSSIFSPGGRLSQALARYETRPQQLEMAEAIAECIGAKKHLLVEAGTGTGKSLAYLVPFILWAVEEDKRVLVTTFTKTLQRQLMDNDLPLLEEVLDVEFRYALCLGTQNYLCPRRFRQSEQVGLYSSRKEVEQMQAINRWAERTGTGLVQELDFEPSYDLWGQINRETDLCFAQKCHLYHDSFYWRARRQQQRAHVLVANHHLFFANLAAAGNVLPKYDAVVFDEAHNLESVASAYLGLEISSNSVQYILDRIHGRRGGGLMNAVGEIPGEFREEVESCVAECRHNAEALFDEAAQKLGHNASTYRLRVPDCIENPLEQPLLRLAKALGEIKESLALDGSSEDPLDDNRGEEPGPDAGEAQAYREELAAFESRVLTLRGDLESFLKQRLDNSVYWIETTRGARQKRISFRTAPVQVAEALTAEVFSRTAPIVLTSATLTHSKSFSFIQQQLGLQKAETLGVGSPFDFMNQVLLYIARDLPEPGTGRSDFEVEAIGRSMELVRRSKGRAFVLCTSHRMVQQCAERFEKELPQYRLLRQGEMPRERLLAAFHEDIESVLIGTSTFWQGVDVPGEALECVILTKLPFAVPDDPLVEARMEFLQSQDIDPFYNYQVPQAVLQFRQGFGRLVRHRNDFGMVAILDPRVIRKRYGGIFLSSLPDCRQTDSLEEVEEFFARQRDPAHRRSAKPCAHTHPVEAVES